MSRTKARRRKICPVGVIDDCSYCIREEGKAWRIYDPKGDHIDDAQSRSEALEIADLLVMECVMAQSGYGSAMPRKPGRAKPQFRGFRWKRKSWMKQSS